MENYSKSNSPSQTIVNIVTHLLSPDNNQRNNAENELRNQKLSNIPFLINDLLIILKEPNTSLNVKKLCSIIIKNTLFDSSKNWFALSCTEQSNIKKFLQQIISPTTDVETMKQSACILSSIAFIELTEQNQSQIKQLIEAIVNQNQTQNPIVTSVYLYSIKLFFEQIKEMQAIDSTLIQPIISQILLNLSFSRNIDIIVLTLELVVLILPFIKNYIRSNKENILVLILNIIHIHDNIQIIVKALLAIYEILTLYYVQIACFAEQIFNTVISLISNSKIMENTLYSINILCLICDNETITQTRMAEYMIGLTKNIATLMITVIESNTQLEIEEEWSISRACCYFLSYLIHIQSNSSLVEMLLIYVSNTFYDLSPTKRYVSLLILSCCLESKHKEALSTLLLCNMANIWAKINIETNQVLSIALSWLLGKISELLPNVFERKSFNELIPTLINIITSEELNIIARINTAITFSNIIRFYGDENTSHNKNSFSTYYKLFVDKFTDLACHLNTNSSRLSFYLLRIVMNVVQYSSLEYQDQLEILLSRLISYFENISNSINQNLNNNNALYHELQVNLCLIIHQIFSKIIRRADKHLCKRLYNAIIVSFQQNEPYESGILCLFNIVVIIDNNINQFFNYLFECFNHKDNYLLIQGAVATISNLAWNKNSTFNQWSNQIMASLFSLLTDNDIKFSIKPLAISAIGDICYNFPLSIIENIQPIVTLLFSTFEVVIATKDEDCMLILKNSIESFSMLLFSIQETQKEHMIFMYIKQLLGYIIYFSSIERIEIKTNLIMLYGDLINLLGERIREFTTKEEVKLIQGKLQENANDNSLKWMNSIIDKIF